MDLNLKSEVNLRSKRFLAKLDKLANAGDIKKLKELRAKNKEDYYAVQRINFALEKAKAHVKAINSPYCAHWIPDGAQTRKFYGIKHNL